MLSMSTLFALLHSKCYYNIWHIFFFCWHLFSLLFHVNKVLWDPGILCPPLLYPFEMDSNLLQDVLLVFKPASCQPVGCSNRWRVWWPYAFILIRLNWNELIRQNPNSEMCGLWAGLVLAGVSPFMPCSVCCLFVSYLFRVGHSTDMCGLLQENLLGGKKESVSRSYVHVCWKKVMKH